MTKLRHPAFIAGSFFNKILKQVQDDMTSHTNVQCVVVPLLFDRNKRRCGLCLRKALQPLLAHALAVQDDMASSTNVWCGVVPQALQDDML